MSSKTIDITLVGSETNVNVSESLSPSRLVLVSLSKAGFTVGSDGSNRSITVEFAPTLTSVVYWTNVIDKPDLKPVATSGDYDDLTDKPQINGVTLQGDNSASELGLATAEQGALAASAYQKPSTGIPKTDLDSGVQTSLGNADTAVQPTDLATVATSGDYDDLLNKPTIPDVSGKADKVSGATNGNLAALDSSGNLTDSGSKASDFATLDSGGKVPSSQLPSYVDDVLEYTSLVQFPAIGESGKIYVALNANKTYRWSGSTYVEIAQGLALGETSSTAFAGDRGKAIEDKIPSNASTSNKLATASEAVPAGGTTGQVLTKHSDADNDVEWADPQGGGGTGDYEELDNLPSINGVTLKGELETEDLNIEALTNEEIDALLV